MVVVPKDAEQLAPPEDLVAVNGTSLLWAAAREQILSLTSRMPAGPVMLPTMNFYDLKKGLDVDERATLATKALNREKTKAARTKA